MVLLIRVDVQISMRFKTPMYVQDPVKKGGKSSAGIARASEVSGRQREWMVKKVHPSAHFCNRDNIRPFRSCVYAEGLGKEGGIFAQAPHVAVFTLKQMFCKGLWQECIVLTFREAGRANFGKGALRSASGHGRDFSFMGRIFPSHVMPDVHVCNLRSPLVAWLKHVRCWCSAV